MSPSARHTESPANEMATPSTERREAEISADVCRLRRRSTAFILLLALPGRLLVLWIVATARPHNWLFSHPWEMGLLANTLLHGQGYSSPFGVPTGPTALIAPGYPTLIAAVFSVFGSDTFASEIAIVALQVAVGLITIWLMMRIARVALDDRTALLAGAIWAITPPLLWIPAIFWETSLSACALPAMVLLALRCSRSPSVARWAALGACGGIASLVNPALLPSLLAILGWAAWQTRRVARAAPLAGLFALLLLFAPWPVRNAVRFHAFIPLRSTAGFELWMGNRPGATGYLDESLFPMYNRAELASYIAKGEVAYTRGKTDAAWQYIRQQPGSFVRLSVRRCLRFWSGTGNLETSRFDAVYALSTTLLGFSGLILLFRNRRMRAFAVSMALPLLLFPLPYYITHAEFRYRLNIDPLLTILAAYAVIHLAGARGRMDSAHPRSDANLDG